MENKVELKLVENKEKNAAQISKRLHSNPIYDKLKTFVSLKQVTKNEFSFKDLFK